MLDTRCGDVDVDVVKERIADRLFLRVAINTHNIKRTSDS